MPPLDPAYVASGAGVGLLVGLTGVGGGSLMTPLLMLVFGVQPATAVGTDLLYASVTKTAGGAVHGGMGSVMWTVVGRLALGSVPAAALTLWVLYLAGKPSPQLQTAITITLGAVLVATAVLILVRAALVGRLVLLTSGWSGRRRATATVAIGLLLGVLVSLTSVGAGALGVTALLVLYPELPASRIVGSDIAHAVPLTLLAGLGHWLAGAVDAVLLVSLLAGSVPAVLLGSLLGARAPDRFLQPLLALVLALVGVRLVI